MASTLPRLPVFEAIKAHHPQSTAIVHYPSGRNFTYGELVHDVADAAESLRGKAKGNALVGERVAFLVENGYDYVGRLTFELGVQLMQLLIASSDFTVYLRKPFRRCTSMHHVPKP
jgi:malonyl-CoA/methylmalonyl-CoA synthetase